MTKLDWKQSIFFNFSLLNAIDRYLEKGGSPGRQDAKLKVSEEIGCMCGLCIRRGRPCVVRLVL